MKLSSAKLAFNGGSVEPKPRGNLTDDGTFTYKYDARNRVVLIKTQHDGVTLSACDCDDPRTTVLAYPDFPSIV